MYVKLEWMQISKKELQYFFQILTPGLFFRGAIHFLVKFNQIK